MQKRPRFPHEVVGLLDADVAAPDHARASGPEGLDHARRLRIVNDHHVPFTAPPGELLHVLGKGSFVYATSLVVERATVAERPVEAIVETLGDGEELWRAVDHDPASIHARAARVRDQRAQQLDHAPAVRRRVHVPYDASVEQLARLLDAMLELLEARGWKHRAKTLRVHRGDVHLMRHQYAGTPSACSRPQRSRSSAPISLK